MKPNRAKFDVQLISAFKIYYLTRFINNKYGCYSRGPTKFIVF